MALVLHGIPHRDRAGQVIERLHSHLVRVLFPLTDNARVSLL